MKIDWNGTIALLVALILPPCALSQGTVDEGIVESSQETVDLLSQYSDSSDPEQQWIIDAPNRLRGYPVHPDWIVTGQKSTPLQSGWLGNVLMAPPLLLNVDSPRFIPIDVPSIIEQQFQGLLMDDRILGVIDAFNRLGTGMCSQQASNFYDAWLDFRDSYAQQYQRTRTLRRYMAADERIKLEEVFADYDTNCLIADVGSIPLSVRSVVGILELFDGTWHPFCTATLVNDRTVITSKHCFVERSTGIRSVGCAYWPTPQGIVVRFLHDLGRAYRLVKLSIQCLNRNERYSVLNDYVEATLGEDVVKSVPARIAQRSNAILPGTSFWSVGYSSYVTEAYGEKAQPLPLAAIRYAPVETCGVLAATTSCVFHSCQTAPGTSGAGLLREVDGAVELIGVHFGSSEPFAVCGEGAPQTKDVNLAIRLYESR